MYTFLKEKRPKKPKEFRNKLRICKKKLRVRYLLKKIATSNSKHIAVFFINSCLPWVTLWRLQYGIAMTKNFQNYART